MSNIVQAEFFHVGGKNVRSLQKLLEECDERIAEGHELALEGIETNSRIKTVVRFFDSDGSMTAFAREFEEANRRKEAAFAGFMEAGNWKREWMNLRSRRLAGKILALKGQAAKRAAQALKAGARLPNQIAVERQDHSFRLARKDELHELCEAAQRATSVWLFIFEPNNLLAERNEPVANVM